MSGGAYGYVTQRIDEIGRIDNGGADWEQLCDRVADCGWMPDVAAEIAAITAVAESLTARLRKLGAVLEAVEWWDSNDYGEGQVRDALAEFRAAGGAS